MLKATAESIAEPQARLFRLSLSKGKFPKLRKTAGIVSIPKSTSKSKSDPTEYRPISLSVWYSMLLFRISSGVFKRIYKSTTSLLLHTTHDWFTLLNQQMESCVCFFNFKNDFYTVSHRKIMNIYYVKLVTTQYFFHGCVAI